MAYYAFSTFDAERRRRPAAGPRRRRSRQRRADDRGHRSRSAGARQPTGRPPPRSAETCEYLVGSIPRLLETNPGIAAFLQTAEQFGLGLDYDRRLPGAPARRHARRDPRRGRGSALNPERRRRSRSPGPREVAVRSDERHARRLLRRRLHADPPRARVPGHRLSRLLRPPRHHRRRRRRSTRAVAAASVDRSTPAGGIYDPEIFIRYTRRIIEGMGGSGAGVERGGAGHLRRVVRLPPLRRCTRTCPTCCGRCTPRG